MRLIISSKPKEAEGPSGKDRKFKWMCRSLCCWIPSTMIPSPFLSHEDHKKTCHLDQASTDDRYLKCQKDQGSCTSARLTFFQHLFWSNPNMSCIIRIVWIFCSTSEISRSRSGFIVPRCNIFRWDNCKSKLIIIRHEKRAGTVHVQAFCVCQKLHQQQQNVRSDDTNPRRCRIVRY